MSASSGDTIYFRPSIQPGSGQLGVYLDFSVNRAVTAQQVTKELEAKSLAATATLEDAAAKWMVKSMDGTIAPN